MLSIGRPIATICMAGFTAFISMNPAHAKTGVESALCSSSSEVVDWETDVLGSLANSAQGSLPERQVRWSLQKPVKASSDLAVVEFEFGRRGEGVENFILWLRDHGSIDPVLQAVNVEVFLGGRKLDTQLRNELPRTASSVVSRPPALVLDSAVDKIALEIPESWLNSTTGEVSSMIQKIELCPAQVRLSASKTITTNQGVKPALRPGEQIITSLTVENTGAGWVDEDSIELIDAIGDNLVFVNDGSNYVGSETDIIEFVDHQSGLTFDQASDVRFSNSAIRPASFEDCKYSPQAGLDPDVEYICIRPRGVMRGSDGRVGFSVRYTSEVGSFATLIAN